MLPLAAVSLGCWDAMICHWGCWDAIGSEYTMGNRGSKAPAMLPPRHRRLCWPCDEVPHAAGALVSPSHRLTVGIAVCAATLRPRGRVTTTAPGPGPALGQVQVEGLRVRVLACLMALPLPQLPTGPAGPGPAGNGPAGYGPAGYGVSQQLLGPRQSGWVGER
jgi:hypothetical protein